MEVAEKTKERSTVILAVMTLVVIGVTVMLSTNQTFRHQREAEEQHLYLTSRAVYLAIESSVRRGPVREGEDRLSPRTADFFQALEQDGDVLFVGIIDELGGDLLTSPLHGDKPVLLPRGMVEEMRQGGEWHGRLILDNHGAYVYGKRLMPLRGMHMSLRDDLGPPGFLVVGIDMEKYLGAYAGFRKNVLFQALYILAAAIITWGLGVSFLARREQAKKAAALELFQARLLDNLPDGLITLGPDGTVRSANPAALRILKRASRDVLGRLPSDLPPDVAACVAFDPGGEQTFGQGGKWRHCAYQGAQLEIMTLPLSDDAEHARLVIIRDRTTLRNLEKSLADAEKLAAVGTLAAGVAHEVRNPLSSLRGFAQYFVKKLSGRQPEEEYAKTMVREADRLNRVITDLLFLGRPKAIAPREVELDPLIREIFALLRFDFELRGVTPVLELEAHSLFADPEALKQALINLVLNSLDALKAKEEKTPLPARAAHAPRREPGRDPSVAGELPSGPGGSDTGGSGTDGSGRGGSGPDSSGRDPGDPSAGTGEGWRDPALPLVPDSAYSPPLAIVSGKAPGGAWVEVRDTGCGMDSGTRVQAFEAFFTDKEHGTGLGLALVRRTMLDHGGDARIAAEPGAGCAVRLFFPQGPAARTEVAEPHENAPGN